MPGLSGTVTRGEARGGGRRMSGRGALIVLLTVLPLLYAPLLSKATASEPPIDLEVFVREGCPHCESAKLFLADLQQERPDLRIGIRDIHQDPLAFERLKALAPTFGVRVLGVPAFYLRGQLLIGYHSADTTGARLRELLNGRSGSAASGSPAEACLPETSQPCERASVLPPPFSDGLDLPWFGQVSVRRLGLPLFTLAIGLLDGFNPCAMWVLLFLLSLLVNLHDRMKMILIAGTFVAVSGLFYFAFMAAWLNVFLIIGWSRAVQITLGSVAFLAGAVNVKDCLAFGRGPSLSIPDAVKPGFYAQVRRILQADNVAGALIGMIGLAVLVNMIELLCTAGFPALYTQVLALQQLPPWKYYGYLGLYNVAYILDDSLMVGIAVFTLGRHKLQEREGRWLKLASGLVMIGLGSVLLLRPKWLI